MTHWWHTILGATGQGPGSRAMDVLEPTALSLIPKLAPLYITATGLSYVPSSSFPLEHPRAEAAPPWFPAAPACRVSHCPPLPTTFRKGVNFPLTQTYTSSEPAVSERDPDLFMYVKNRAWKYAEEESDTPEEEKHRMRCLVLPPPNGPNHRKKGNK